VPEKLVSAATCTVLLGGKTDNLLASVADHGVVVGKARSMG
jgi:hypothetical protein